MENVEIIRDHVERKQEEVLELLPVDDNRVRDSIWTTFIFAATALLPTLTLGGSRRRPLSGSRDYLDLRPLTSGLLFYYHISISEKGSR